MGGGASLQVHDRSRLRMSILGANNKSKMCEKIFLVGVVSRAGLQGWAILFISRTAISIVFLY